MINGLLFAVFLVAVHTNPVQEWKRTITKMNERMCGNPQSLSYPLVEFAEIERIEPNLAYEELRNVSKTLLCFFSAAENLFFQLHPPWIVVQRCTPTSGCCNKPKHICGVKDFDFVSMVYFHKRKKQFHKIHFENHLSCQCKNLKDMPK